MDWTKPDAVMRTLLPAKPKKPLTDLTVGKRYRCRETLKMGKGIGGETAFMAGKEYECLEPGTLASEISHCHGLWNGWNDPGSWLKYFEEVENG